MAVRLSPKVWPTSCLDLSLGRIGICSGRKGPGFRAGSEVEGGSLLEVRTEWWLPVGGEVKGKREREREWGLGGGQGLSRGGLSLP